MASHLELLRLELEAALQHVNENNAAQTPSGKWNSAQIIEHLFLTYRNTNRGLAKCLEKGAPRVTPATLKQRMGMLLVVNLGYMPPGRKAPEIVVPQGMAAGEARAAILGEIEKMESGLDDCERRFGRQTKIMDHIILGPLTANQWRKFHLVHGRHHIRQLRARGGS